MKIIAKVDDEERNVYLNKVCQMTSPLCRTLNHIEVCIESGKEIHYYPFTEEELNCLKKWGWSIIEYNLFNENFDESIYEFIGRYRDLFIDKIVRCISEGFIETESGNEMNKFTPALRGLILGIDLYFYPKPYTNFISILLNSLENIFSYISSVDTLKLILSLKILTSLYRYCNLSSIYYYIL